MPERAGVIVGGWNFVIAAYCITAVGLVALHLEPASGATADEQRTSKEGRLIDAAAVRRSKARARSPPAIAAGPRRDPHRRRHLRLPRPGRPRQEPRLLLEPDRAARPRRQGGRRDDPPRRPRRAGLDRDRRGRPRPQVQDDRRHGDGASSDHRACRRRCSARGSAWSSKARCRPTALRHRPPDGQARQRVPGARQGRLPRRSRSSPRRSNRPPQGSRDDLHPRPRRRAGGAPPRDQRRRDELRRRAAARRRGGRRPRAPPRLSLRRDDDARHRPDDLRPREPRLLGLLRRAGRLRSRRRCTSRSSRLWSSLEGSILFWGLVLGAFTSPAAACDLTRERHPSTCRGLRAS